MDFELYNKNLPDVIANSALEPIEYLDIALELVDSLGIKYSCAGENTKVEVYETLVETMTEERMLYLVQLMNMVKNNK